MEPFVKHSGVAASLPLINVDTDMIIPKQFLKTIKRTGLGQHLFDEMRFTPEGKEVPDFVLNQDDYRDASVLISGDNFGCGSSREHAPWSIKDFGIRVIIAPSFADIFYNNCFKNGILPIALDKEAVDALTEYAQSGRKDITVDLPEQKIVAGNYVFDFEVDPSRKHSLLNGLDDIGTTIQQFDDIKAYEGNRKSVTPWLFA